MPKLNSDPSRSIEDTARPLPRAFTMLEVELRGDAILATMKRQALRGETNLQDVKAELTTLGALGKPILLDLSRQTSPSEELTSALLTLVTSASPRDPLTRKPVHPIAIVTPSQTVAQKLEKQGIPQLMSIHRDRLAAFTALGIDRNTPGTPL